MIPDLWDVDPLPLPTGAVHSAEWWRCQSKAKLQERGTMESPHWTGSDDRDSLSARPCDRCAEQDAITTWDHLYVCGDCFRALENYDGEPVEFDRELAKTYPRTA